MKPYGGCGRCARTNDSNFIVSILSRIKTYIDTQVTSLAEVLNKTWIARATQSPKVLQVVIDDAISLLEQWERRQRAVAQLLAVPDFVDWATLEKVKRWEIQKVPWPRINSLRLPDATGVTFTIIMYINDKWHLLNTQDLNFDCSMLRLHCSFSGHHIEGFNEDDLCTWFVHTFNGVCATSLQHFTSKTDGLNKEQHRGYIVALSELPVKFKESIQQFRCVAVTPVPTTV